MQLGFKIVLLAFAVTIVSCAPQFGGNCGTARCGSTQNFNPYCLLGGCGVNQNPCMGQGCSQPCYGGVCNQVPQNPCAGAVCPVQPCMGYGCPPPNPCCYTGNLNMGYNSLFGGAGGYGRK